MTATPRVTKGAIRNKPASKIDVTVSEGDLDFRALVEASLSGIMVFQDERIVYVNPAATEFLGYTKDELLNMRFWEIIHPDFHDMAREYGLSLLKGEQAESRTETRVIGKDGRECWTDSFISRIEYHGRPAVLVTAVDITERKQAEDALRKNEKFLNNVFNCIQDGVSVLSKDLSVIRYNPTIEKWHGRDLTGKKCYRLFHGREEPCETCPSVRAIREKTMQREVVRDLIGWKEIYAFPLVNGDGEVTGTIEQVRDITESKRAEEALSKNLAVLARSQEIAHLGSWSLDFDSGKFEISREMYRMHGLEPGTVEPTLELSSKLTHPDDRERYMNFVESIRWEGRMGGIDYRIVRPDGTVRYMHVTTDSVVRGPDGRVKMASGITQDITERKHAEEALKEAKVQAELYLDLMGHDINNMHQIALGYMEMAQDMHPEAGDSGFLDKPIEVLQRSARLIKNVRKLQKVHDGVFQTELVDVCEVLSDVQRELGAVPNKAITLNMNEREHCRVRANQLLHDVFANLVSNAIKHTGDHADIDIDLDIVNDNGSRYCRVCVEDNGPGIPDNFKGVIFNRVLKGSNKAKGMGLGLYLVKSLVESYDGRVWVDDRIAGDHTKGARFVVLLPAVDQ